MRSALNASSEMETLRRDVVIEKAHRAWAATALNQRHVGRSVFKVPRGRC